MRGGVLGFGHLHPVADVCAGSTTDFDISLVCISNGYSSSRFAILADYYALG